MLFRPSFDLPSGFTLDRFAGSGAAGAAGLGLDLGPRFGLFVDGEGAFWFDPAEDDGLSGSQRILQGGLRAGLGLRQGRALVELGAAQGWSTQVAFSPESDGRTRLSGNGTTIGGFLAPGFALGQGQDRDLVLLLPVQLQRDGGTVSLRVDLAVALRGHAAP